jgi:hypothetical protein
MATFDITPLILGGRSSIWDRSRRDTLPALRTWLSEHVGEYYGRGDDPVVDIGSGWEIVVLRNGKRTQPTEIVDTVVTWELDITDEEKSVLFALRWVS